MPKSRKGNREVINICQGAGDTLPADTADCVAGRDHKGRGSAKRCWQPSAYSC